MHKYRCYHIIARTTERVIEAESSFVARKELARELNSAVTDIVAIRVDWKAPDHPCYPVQS
jgi:hypothetical protein